MNRRLFFLRSALASAGGVIASVFSNLAFAASARSLPPYLRPNNVPPGVWLENEEGERFFHVQKEGAFKVPPKGFIYHHARFPDQINHAVRRFVLSEEVNACPHEKIQATGGWIDGVEGHECLDCKGSQTRNTNEPWPDKWDAHGSRQILSGDRGWSDSLVTAMVRSGEWSAADAVTMAAVSCERCMNVLYHTYGLDDGYPLHSDAWKRCGTSCELCEASEGI